MTTTSHLSEKELSRYSELRITGNTYPAKAKIAAVGGSWNKAGGYWSVDINRPKNQLASVAGLTFALRGSCQFELL